MRFIPFIGLLIGGIPAWFGHSRDRLRRRHDTQGSKL
jgi:hypothetical protein